MSLSPVVARLFFCPVWRFHSAMDESLECIIHRALDEARAKGRDYITQTELAVRAGHEVRPDMTAPEILAMVRRLQQS